MQDSHDDPGAPVAPHSTEASTFRLVIRAEIIPEGPAATVQPPRLNRRAVALAVGSVTAVLALGWIGINYFITDSPATPAVSASPRTIDVQTPAPVADPTRQSDARSAVPATDAATDTSTNALESSATTTPDSPPLPINEALPDVPRSALNTIRGTVRVAMKVVIDPRGAVSEVTTHQRGPSRYFERLSREAAQEWTFTPAKTEQPRSMLLRFHFTQEGATAWAEPVDGKSTDDDS